MGPWVSWPRLGDLARARARSRYVFESSTAFALFDHFRVPYRQSGKTDPLGLEWVRAASASLLWPGDGLLGKTWP